MTVLENILSQEIIQRLGWTLLHFVWQAAAVAVLLAILLRALQKSTPNTRYIIACSALALIVLLPVVTIRLVPASASYSGQKAEDRIQRTEYRRQIIEDRSLVVSPRLSVLEEPEQPETVGAKTLWKEHATELLELALPYIVFGWLVGVFGLSLWHLGGWAQLQRLRRKMVKQVDLSLQSKLKELADKLRVYRAVQILESALVEVPTVVGWLKPVILLPATALTGLSTDQLEAMLAHELAHIKRFDYLVNMLQTVVEILGFYHPAVWWVSHKIRTERENCCDDLAVSISGDRVRYAKALTLMEEIRVGRSELAVAASGGNLFRRIRRLLGKDSMGKTSFSWIPAATAILLIIALVIPTTLALTTKSNNIHADPNTVMLVDDEAAWEESVNGLRMRVTAPAGTEYVRLQTLPLVIAIQNISDEGFPIHRLPVGVRAEATDEAGKKLDLIEPVTISPWDGRSGYLPAGAVVSWTCWFERFQFVNPPEDGSQIELCFILPTRDQRSEPNDGTAALFFVKSNSIQITLKDTPPIPLSAGNLPEQWAPFMDFSYREQGGLPGIYRGMHIDREGYTTIVGRNSGLPSGRMEVVLDHKHLEKLTKFLRTYKVWELAKVKSRIAGIDEPEISLSLNSAGTSLSCRFPESVAKTLPTLVKLRREIQALITTATTIWEETQKGWGEETEGIQCRLRADKVIWKYGEIPTFKADVRNSGMHELFVAQAQELCELEFDGQWYRWNGEVDVKSSAFGPGRRYNDIVITLIDNWRSKSTYKSLNLDAGKHTICVAFFASPPSIGNVPKIQTVSNPVEIEILPREKTSDVQVEGDADKTFGRLVNNSAFFTPPITRLVNDTSERTDCLINFDNNKLYSLPSDYYSWSRRQQQAWDNENGIDAGCETTKGEEGLWGQEMVIIPIPSEEFDRIPPSSFQGLLMQATPATPAVMTAIGELPKTYIFKTREGGMGLLQILEVQRKQKPNYVKIRYKMVPRTADAEAKITSNKKLQDLGKAMVFFAQDHQERLPDSLQDFAPYLRDKQDIDWLSQNVEYLGKGKSEKDRPDTIIAYDRALLQSQQGTNVLFLDAHVEYAQANQLKKFGISFEYRPMTKKVEAETQKLAVVFELQNISPEKVAELLRKVLKLRVENTEDHTREAAPVEVVPDTNKLVVLGNEADIQLIKNLLDELDVPTDKEPQVPISIVTRLYKLEHVNYKQLAELLQSLFEDNQYVRIAPHEPTNTIIIQASESDHKRIENLIQQLDMRRDQMSLKGAIPKQELTIPRGFSEIEKRTESGRKLSKLANALLIYAIDHDEKYPDSLQQLRDYAKDEELKWALENLKYLAKGKTTAEPPQTVIAYDKTLLAEAKGTNVLFNDSHIEFVNSDRLKKLGIRRAAIEIETRFLMVSENFLKDFSLDANSVYISDAWLEYLAAESADTARPVTYSLILDDPNVSSLLKAAQAQKDASMLTAPRTVVLEGEEAQIAIQRAMPYVSGYAEPNQPSTKPEPKHDSINKGFQLQVMLRITPDDKNILLNAVFELSELIGFEKRMYKEKYPYETPEMDIVKFKTRVSVPNGGTLISGGQKIAKFMESISSEPKSSEPSATEEFLRSYNISKEKKILLILVKPTILSPEQADKLDLDRPFPESLGLPTSGGYGGFGYGAPPEQAGQGGYMPDRPNEPK